MRVKVLIADDNPVVRAGLRTLLELDDEVQICAEASSGPQALELTKETSPDVVLLDVRMPGGGGLEVLEEIATMAKVLMLTYSDEADVVSKALSSGATGYLVHGSFESAELSVAIKDTAAGGTRLSPSAAAVLLKGIPSHQAPGSHQNDPELTVHPDVADRAGLSRREKEIASLMVQGLSNPEMARELYIEEKTVKNHINRLFPKLGVASRAEAIALLLGLRPE